MLRNYLKVSLRNLWKRRTHSVINVLGLAIGIASAIIIFLIVRYETSFDQFHEKADRVYRVISYYETNEGKQYPNSGTPRPLPEAFRQDFASEVAAVVPMERYYGLQRVQRDTLSLFMDETIMYTENGFFQLFDFPLREGDRQTALSQPNEVVITEQLSQQLFGRTSDVVEELIIVDGHTLKVSGVLADYPDNTGFNFDILVSFASPFRHPEKEEDAEAWHNRESGFQTYVLLAPQVLASHVMSRLDEFLYKYDEESKPGDKGSSHLQLQPLTEIHYNEQLGDFPYRKISKEKLGGLIILAVLLVLLACINFINLATAMSTQRAKEVGVRKTIGSSRGQIIVYFLTEVLLVTLLALFLALGLTELGLIQLHRWYAYLGSVHLTMSGELLVFLVLLMIVITALSGFYPAFVLARFRPVQLFHRTAVTPRRGRATLRQALVVFQFFVTQVFILGIIIIGQQLRYVLEAPLGFNQEAILYVNFADEDPQKHTRLRSALQNYSGVQNASLSMYPAISQSTWAANFGYDGSDEKESKLGTALQFADANYFAAYQIPLIAGEVYAEADSGSGFVVNEAFLQEVGEEHPADVLGKYISVADLDLPIVGVVEDYHTNSFGSKIRPLVITNYSPDYQYLNLKVTMSQTSQVIEKLGEVWEETYTGIPFEYRFLDDAIAHFYEDHQRLLSLIQLFSGIAIFIGCLGLYGLVVFMAEQRTKEIGIRKVLGASVRQLLSLFSGQFVKLVVIAFCLAAPLAYVLMTQWLQSFVYRIEMNALMFVGCLLVSLLLVLLTVGYQSVRAAMANPVDSLRNE